MPLPVWSFSFKGTAFNGPFVLEGNFACVPDLRYTKISNHVDVGGVKAPPSRSPVIKWRSSRRFHKIVCILCRWSWLAWLIPVRLYYKKANDPEDADRLRRLKELAEQSKHHRAALRFYADEERCERWQPGQSFWATLLDLCYDKVSNYGQGSAVG